MYCYACGHVLWNIMELLLLVTKLQMKCTLFMHMKEPVACWRRSRLFLLMNDMMILGGRTAMSFVDIKEY